MTAEMVWDEEEPFERLTLKMLLFFCLFCQAFTSLQSHVQLSHRHVAIVQDFTAVFCFSVDNLLDFGVKKYSLVL